MAKPMWAGLVAGIILAFICGGIYAFTERSHVVEATPDTIVGVDANPIGNTATSLGTINSCISVNVDDVFYIDLVIQDVTNLNYFDGTFRFDASVLEVNSLDATDFFLGSDVYPNLDCSSGQCQVGNVDQGGSGHTGEGVLGRLELRAIGTGISKANYDLRPDGWSVSGVILLDETGTAIGDISDPPDDYFDGDILNAEIAVGEPCPGQCLPDVDTDGDEFDDDVECYLPTDPLDACPTVVGSHDAWPLDIDMDRELSVTGDVFTFRGEIGISYGDPDWWQRLDLDMDGDISVTGDVFLYRGHIAETCTV